MEHLHRFNLDTEFYVDRICTHTANSSSKNTNDDDDLQMCLKLQTIKISLIQISILQSSPQESGTLVHKLNWIPLLDYKLQDLYELDLENIRGIQTTVDNRVCESKLVI